MKLKIFVALLLVAGAWIAGRAYVNGRGAGAERGGASHAVAGEAAPGGSGHVAEENGATVQRIRESYRLATGARVEVHGINGPVEIATGPGDTAEVNAEARADDADVLKRGRITVEYANDRLVVRGPRNGGAGGFLSWVTGRGGRASHNVKLTLPRSVALDASGINGRLRVGELDGALEVAGVNGGVEASSAEGVEVSGVNGRVELRIAPTVNADVDAVGIDGDVSNELKSVKVEQQNVAPFRARLGAGGPRISISGTRGVTLADR